MISKIVIIW